MDSTARSVPRRCRYRYIECVVFAVRANEFVAARVALSYLAAKAMIDRSISLRKMKDDSVAVSVMHARMHLYAHDAFLVCVCTMRLLQPALS